MLPQFSPLYLDLQCILLSKPAIWLAFPLNSGCECINLDLESRPTNVIPQNAAESACRYATADPARVKDDLAALEKYLSQPTSREANQHLLVLPAVYKILEHPDNVFLETVAMFGVYTVCVRFVLRILVLIAKATTIPSEAISDLWPGVWGWIQLHCITLGRVESFIEIEFATLHIQVLSSISLTRGSRSLHQSIDQTPGYRLEVTRAWKWILQNKRADFGAVFDLIGRVVHLNNTDHFHEMLAGAGGLPEDLADLVVLQLEVFAAKVDHDMGGQLLFLRFLCGLLRHSELHDALLEAGMITPLVDLVNRRVINVQLLDKTFVDTCFEVLTKSFRVAPGFPWLIQALKAGILVTLGDYGYLHMLDKTPHLDAILSEFPRHLYNCSVLRHLEKAMEDLKKADHVLT